MSQALPEPYSIEGSVPDRYPRGWFCIGTDYEFTSIPVKLDYFGTSLVAYRGQDSGEVHVLDAYCPHMGANLAGGAPGTALQVHKHGGERAFNAL